MLARVVRALVLGGILGCIGGSPAAPARSTWAASACAAHTPARLPAGVSLVVAVPTRPRDLYTRAGAVQLCRITAAGAINPFSHLLPTNDIAMSAGGRELAYGDSAFRLHLTRLPGSADHVLGHGVLPGFSFDERYLASVPTVWSEGATPAPVPNAAGTLFASLLGTPQGGLNQVVLYAHGRQPRSVRLPGEPRLARFAPEGSQFVAIWTPQYPQGVASHAALVDATTGRVEDLGPAVGAFWTR